MSCIVRKPDFTYAKTKVQISCAVTAELISAFVLATWIVQFLFFLNLKFKTSSHLLQLHRLVCVRPCWKPGRPIFCAVAHMAPFCTRILICFRMEGHTINK